MPPAKLYKYQPFSKYVLENLIQNKLHFSRPKDFNDPFEFRLLIDKGPLVADEEAAAIRGVARKLDAQRGVAHDEDSVSPTRFKHRLGKSMERHQEQIRELGVACFSETNDHPLMWAHYAEGHTGFCLEFSTEGEPFTKALQVDYVEKAPSINPTAWALEDDVPPNFVKLAAATKLKAWKYEREWRSLHSEGDKRFGYDARLLTAIYFGLRMKPSHENIVATILARFRTRTKLFRMGESPGGYGVEPQPVTFTQADY